MRDRAEMMATQAQLCTVSAVARRSAAARVNKTSDCVTAGARTEQTDEGMSPVL
jgi:hypothetical protein